MFHQQCSSIRRDDIRDQEGCIIAAAQYSMERNDRFMSSGQHKGGWTEPVHGTDGDGNDVTASFGTGNNEGHTLLASGHVDPKDFIQGHQHDHFGPGNGPNDNGTQRGFYNS